MLNALLLREASQPLSERLRAKVLILDNARSQEEAQKHEARRRAQLVRKRRRLSGSSLPEEKGRRLGHGSGAPTTIPGGYNAYLPLHEQWRAYFSSVMLQGGREPSSSGSHHSQLQKRVMCSDLHGCLLQVVDSKCRSDINMQGIVVRESSRTFHLITRKDDKVRIIPKAGHVFRLEVEGEGGKVVTVTLYGNGLVDRMKALEVMTGTVKKDKKHRNEGQRAALGPGRIVTTAL